MGASTGRKGPGETDLWPEAQKRVFSGHLHAANSAPGGFSPCLKPNLAHTHVLSPSQSEQGNSKFQTPTHSVHRTAGTNIREGCTWSECVQQWGCIWYFWGLRSVYSVIEVRDLRKSAKIAFFLTRRFFLSEPRVLR